MNPPKDILIIGGGVIGVCIAYYLAAEQHEVTLALRRASKQLSAELTAEDKLSFGW